MMVDDVSAWLPACECRHYKLRALVTRNGERQYAIWCLKTGWRGNFMPKRVAGQIAISHQKRLDDIPVYQDNRAGCCDGGGCDHCSEPCSRCGQYRHVQYHHWAPSYLFDDSDQWPVSPLCRDCHRRWHAVVTPNMHLRRAG